MRITGVVRLKTDFLYEISIIARPPAPPHPYPPHLHTSFTYLETGLRHRSQKRLVPVKFSCILLVEGLGGTEQQDAACRKEEEEAGPEKGEAHDDVTADSLVF